MPTLIGKGISPLLSSGDFSSDFISDALARLTLNCHIYKLKSCARWKLLSISFGDWGRAQCFKNIDDGPIKVALLSSKTSLNPVPNAQVCAYLTVHITKLQLQTTFPKPLYISHC